MTKLTRIIEDLRPTRKYIFRARAINAFGQVSDWSEALVYETPGDFSTPNPPSELSVNFLSPDLVIRWRSPGQNTDGSIISDLDHFLVTIASPSGKSVTFPTGEPLFIFTFEMNKEFFGNPQPKLDVSVVAIDTSDRRSAAATISAENPRPEDPVTPPFLVSAFTLINISMDKGGLADFKRVALYHSTDGVNFSHIQTPIGDLNYTHAVSQASTHYYKYKNVDVFEQESINFSPTASATTLSVNSAIVDVEPPTVPTDFRVEDLGFAPETNSFVEFAWTASTDEDSSVAFYELQYKKTSDFAFQKTLVAGTETETRIEGLKPVADYQARIRAVDIYGNSSAYTSLISFTTATDTTPPAVPTGYVTTSGIGTIGVNWSPNIELDLDHYRLYGEPNNSGFTPSTANLLYTGNGTGHVLTGVDSNDTWYFILVAVDEYDNASDPSVEFSGSSTSTFVEDTTAPATPSNVVLSSNVSTNEQITRARINVTWDANTEDDLAGYEIGFREDGDIPWTTLSVPAGTTSNLISNLLPSTTYDIRIAAFDVSLNKSAFYQANETTPADANPPPMPTNAQQITALRTILFFWDAVTATDLSGYKAQFATDSGFANIIHEWDGNSTSTEFQGESATTYYMRVLAFDRSGNVSNYTTPISTTTALIGDSSSTPPAVPLNVSASEGQDFNGQTEVRWIAVTWSAVTGSGLAGYTVRLRRGTETDYTYQDVSSTATSAKFTGLNTSTIYHVSVEAYDQFGNKSGFSPWVQITTGKDTTRPPNVTGLVIVPFVKSAVLKWNPVSATDLSHYNVYVGTASTFTPTTTNKFTETASTSVSVNKYHNGTGWVDMVEGTTYYFKINAQDRSGNTSLNYTSGNQSPGALTEADLAAAITAANSYTDTATAGLTTTYYLADEPESAQPGDLWIDTDTDKLYRYNGSTWDEVQDDDIAQAISGAATAQAIADGKIRSFYQNEEPTGMVTQDEGDLWFDTNDQNKPHRYNGVAWVAIRDAYIDSAATQAAADALSDANSYTDGAVDGLITTYYEATEPTGAALGDLWIDTDTDRLYRYDGTNWIEIQDEAIAEAIADAATAQNTADGKIRSFYQDAEPTGMVPSDIGDLWFDTNDQNKPYRYDGSDWLPVRDAYIDSAAQAAQAAAIAAANTHTDASVDGLITTYYEASEPTTGSLGDLWIDTDTKRLYRYDGSDWIEIQDEGIAQAIADAASAQTTADGKIESYYDSTEPAEGSEGDLWFDTSNDNEPHRHNGSTWISVRDAAIAAAQADADAAASAAAQALEDAADAADLADGKIDIFYGNTEPTEMNTGDYWLDSGSGNVWKRYDGTNWITVQDTAIQTALTNASNAQTTANSKTTVFYQDDQPPTTGRTVGDTWIETDQGNRMHRWTGGIWELRTFTAAAIAATARELGSNTTFYDSTQPVNPLEGDFWVDTSDGNLLKRYTSGSWVEVQDQAIQDAISAAGTAQATADGKVRTFAQDDQPSMTQGEDVGDIWVDTNNDNLLHRWSGTAWVELRDQYIDAAAQAAQAAAITSANNYTDDTTQGLVTTYYEATQPTGASEGDLWIDTDNKRLYRYNGSTWDEIVDQAIVDAISAADDAQTTADGKIRSFYQNEEPTGMTAGDNGDFWVDTNDNNKLYRWDGTLLDWIQVTDTTPPAVPTGLALTQGVDFNGQVESLYINATWAASTATDLAGYKVRYRRGSETVYSYQDVTTNSAKLTGLHGGFIYRVQVAAYDKSGNISNYSAEVTRTLAKDTAGPPVPTAPTGTANIKTITWLWTEGVPVPDDFSHFEAQVASVNTFASVLYTFKGRANTFSWTAPSFNATYYMRVRGVDVTGNTSSTWSATASATTGFEPMGGDSTPPAVPTGLALTTGQEFVGQVANIYINATWNLNSETDLAGYSVRFYKTGETRYEYVNVPKGNTAAKITGVAPGTGYSAQIAAYDRSGNYSAYSSAATVTSGNDTTRPPNVTGLTTTPFIKSTNVSWNAVVVGDLSHYNVHVGTTSGFTPSATNKVSETFATSITVNKYHDGTSWVDMVPGVVYHFKVNAQDRSGNVSTSFASTSETTDYIQTNSGNLIPNSGFESDSVDHIFSIFGGAYVRSDSEKLAGNYSLAVTTDVDADAEGVSFDTLPGYTLPVGRKAVGSAFIKGPIGESLITQFRVRTEGGTASLASATAQTYTLTGEWQRIQTLPYVDTVNDRIVQLDIRQAPASAAEAFTFYVDNVQLEEGETVSAYTPSPQEFTKPVAPTNLSITTSGDRLDVSFDAVSSEVVDSYEVWAAYETNSGFAIISDIEANDITAGIATVSDQNVTSQGDVFYKVYAVNGGIRSNPLTGSYTVNRTVSEAGLNLNVEPMATSFIITYEVPDDRLLEYVSILHESRIANTGFSEANAIEIYRGFADTYIYEIENYELEYYHKFWVSAKTRA